MNILFITPSVVQPLNGGIERITYSLSEILKADYGYGCFFWNLQSGGDMQQVESLIRKNHIEIVVAQGADKRISQLLPSIKEIIGKLDWKVSLLFVFHSNPGVELATMDCRCLWNRILHRQELSANIKQLGWQTLLPLIRKGMMQHLATKYSMPYDIADKVVLLSEKFIPEYCSIARCDTAKMTAISNMLSFPVEQYYPCDKEKTVLVVSRMEERQKRIKLVLRIWREVEDEGWDLKIVGVGEDLDYYKGLARKWNLRNISFEGRQDPLPYYKTAAIFLMTSAFEGWGLTLTEAQQCGCVPIVFNTYSSLSDIVEHNRNGLIVAEGDVKQYVASLRTLMHDDSLRQRLALNAAEDCLRYTPQKVAAKWDALFRDLQK